MSADSWGNLAGDKHFAAHRKERFECMVGAYTHGTHISAVYLCLLLYETSVRVYLYGCPSACLTLSESVYTDVMRWMVVCVCACEYVCMPIVLCFTLSVKTKDRWLRYIATVTGETSSQQAYSLAG